MWTAKQLGDQLGLTTGPVTRVLEDLAAHRVVERHADTDMHRWEATDWLHTRWHALDLDRLTRGTPEAFEHGDASQRDTTAYVRPDAPTGTRSAPHRPSAGAGRANPDQTGQETRGI